jgi:hypothetical protein
VKRHAFDPFSFVIGALFVTVGGTVLFGGQGVDAVRPWRMWPVAIAVVGVSLITWTVGRAVRGAPAAAAGTGPETALETSAETTFEAGAQTALETEDEAPDYPDGPRP